MWKFCFVALACALSLFGAIEIGHSPILSTITQNKDVFVSNTYPPQVLGSAPLPPNASAEGTFAPEDDLSEPTIPITPTIPASRKPVRIIIPSIGLDTTIIDVGVNEKGEMDVPDGNTKHVGWYKDGVIPGDKGTAVIDAHVFAAFSELKYLKVGGDVYVVAENGKKLHFIVTESTVYKLADITGEMLFASRDQPALNLITCAGKLTSDHSTYDHRLVVYAKFLGEVSESLI